MERKLRIFTGLILFAYAACHFLGHATGVFGDQAIESIGRGIFLAPWRNPVGRAALMASFLAHAGLGLFALLRRRHLRIPALEAWQLGLGLMIPLLLAPHFVDARLGADVFGFDTSYGRILHRFWTGAASLAQQFALLGLVWVHGCIGLHLWLRRHDWYRRRRDFILAVAVAVPLMAALGVVNAGWEEAVSAGPPAGAPERPTAIAPKSAAEQTLAGWAHDLQTGYLVLLGLVVAAWLARVGVRRRAATIRVTYPNGRVVVAPRGFSVLETSRWAGIAHASSCGGRGRCSTCRVQILAGEQDVPEITGAERGTLERIKAPPHVRLACQLRPTADLEIAPLVPIADAPRNAGADGESREMLVTAMFIDLRDSTRFAAGRLPFDALYILERYVELVTAAIEANGGAVTGVAGDGVMSLFGVRSEPLVGARGALRAIGAAWDAIDALSQEFASELDRPIAFGAGLHVSLAAVRSLNVAGQSSLQFLGDAGNVASRLEAATKTYRCTCVISEAVFHVAGAAIPSALAPEALTVRGLEDREIPVRLAFHREEVRFGEFAAPKAEASL